jgi:hypothetical protein
MGWYNDLRFNSVDRMMMAKKSKRTSHQMPYLALLDDQVARLRQVERRLDCLFRRVVNGLDEEELARASERFDELVLAFSELRLPNLDCPQEIQALLSRLDLESGPLPGFEKAMAQLYNLSVTPQFIRLLRSKLYTVAAQVAESRADLLPTVAVASLSLDPNIARRNTFVEMVLCASAIESAICATLEEGEPVSVDVSTWLAAQPTDALIAAVGEGAAYYYASIPGVLPLLDESRVLFDVDQLVPGDGASALTPARQDGHGLDSLVDGEYKAILSGEIQRVCCALRQRYEARSIADVEMLAQRALDALELLPPQVNPLLQAIFVQSWVRYFTYVS